MNTSPAPISESARALTGPPAATESGVRLGRVAIIAALLILIAAFAWLLPRWHQRAALRAETEELAAPFVVVAHAKPGAPGAGLVLPAEVRPEIEAPIYARASGYLKRWLVDIGSKVKAGDLLAEIDTPELNQELERARAELAQAQAGLSLAKITAARWADLLKTSSVSEQEAAEKQSDLALKTANLQAAGANVRRLEELQSFARVTAPFAGTITSRRTDVGDLIAAGSNKELFRLAQTGTLRVYVHVPQTGARNVAIGQIADLTIPELPGRHIPAKVVSTAGAMDTSSRTLLTQLEVDNSSGDLLAGSYAEVRLPDGKAQAALTLPANTLLFRAEGTQVAVVQPDGTVALRRVQIGRDFGPDFEVLDGVTAADEVIVNPWDSISDGAKVRKPEPSPTATSAH